MQQVDLKFSHPCGIMYCNTSVYINIKLCSFYCGYFCAINCKFFVNYLFLSKSVAIDLGSGNFKIILRCL